VTSTLQIQQSDVVNNVWNALDVLTDPEIPVITLREMGIIRDVELLPDNTVVVVITPTYSGCPAMEQIHDDVRCAVKALGLQVEVKTQLASMDHRLDDGSRQGQAQSLWNCTAQSSMWHACAARKRYAFHA